MDKNNNDGNFISANIVSTTANEEKSTLKSVHKRKYNTKKHKKQNKEKQIQKKSRREILEQQLIIDEKSRELMKDGLQDIVTKQRRGGRKKSAEQKSEDAVVKKDSTDLPITDLPSEINAKENTAALPLNEVDEVIHENEEKPQEATEENTDVTIEGDGKENDTAHGEDGDIIELENLEQIDTVADTDEPQAQNETDTKNDGLNEDSETEFLDSDEADGTDGNGEGEFIGSHIDADGLEHYSILKDDPNCVSKEEIEEKISAYKNEYEKPKKVKKAQDTDKERAIDSRFDFIELFVFTLCAVLLITTFVFRHSIVEGASMMGTLHDGDHLIISDLFYSPNYGDIVVVEDYTTGLRAPIVKRVIALAGDVVSVKNNYVNNTVTVYVNGIAIEESYVYIDGDLPPLTVGQQVYVDNYVVPEGEIYVMGDHRNNSTDSRYFGAVNEQAVLGKVLLRFMPFERFGTVD